MECEAMKHSENLAKLKVDFEPNRVKLFLPHFY